MTEREQFEQLIDAIENDVLRQAAKEMTKDLPDYFWLIPASSSGKYHPECDLGEGGLVRHSIMVCTVALDLLESEIFIRKTPTNTDFVIVAALFHDGLKNGEVNSEHTVFEHPLISADFVRKHLEKKGMYSFVVNTICSAIESHMGKWNTSTYSDVVLRVPQTDFEKLIHTADYVASRKYIKWKGE